MDLKQKFEEIVQKFNSLHALKDINSVDAAGVHTPLKKITDADLWFKLLPICLWISTQDAGKSNRLLIGVVGSPGKSSD